MLYVAFLRAINVGGHVVKMDQLKAQFETLDFSNVSTFIASGNVIFESETHSAQLEPRIERHLRDWLGYAVGTFLRTELEVASIAAHEPFADPGRVYVVLLRTAPDADTRRRILDLTSERDQLVVHDREIYWQPESFGDSPVGGALGKILGPENTIRNANTLRRLVVKCASRDQAPRRSRNSSGSPSTASP
jgi:uncharacterized protein (DUF1697 family)